MHVGNTKQLKSLPQAFPVALTGDTHISFIRIGCIQWRREPHSALSLWAEPMEL